MCLLFITSSDFTFHISTCFPTEILTLWLHSFFCYPRISTEIFLLQTLTWYGLSYPMFTVWHRYFFLVLMFPGLRIVAPPPSTVSIYTLFLRRRTRKFNFRSYVPNLVEINISLCLSKVGSLGADVQAFRATLYRAGQFIGL